MHNVFSGLIAPVYTPMRSTGELDLETVPRYVEFLLDSGIRGLFVCGSTGEFPSLTMNERKATAEAWAAYVKATANIIADLLELEEAKNGNS